MLHFFCSEQHFKTHWEPLCSAVRGQWISRDELDNPSLKDVPVFVASWGDLRKAAASRSVIIMGEHGTGLVYNENHPSHAGSVALKDQVALRLLPNTFAAQKERKYNPGLRIEVIGVPRTDAFMYRRRPAERGTRASRKPLVVISTHWDCKVCPELGSAFEYYKEAIASAAFCDKFELALHAHPRIATRVGMFARAQGIRFIRNFEQVLQEADLYGIDNSSTLFEFAATGKPVLVINSPEYRRDVVHEYNPRFWSHADIGVNVWAPEELERGIIRALADVPAQKARRAEVVHEVLPYLGRSTRRATAIIEDFLRERVPGTEPRRTRYTGPAGS